MAKTFKNRQLGYAQKSAKVTDAIIGLQKVTPTNIIMTPKIDEDALYKRAFNELQGEAEGEEKKAKAPYISARAASLKQRLMEKFEVDRLEAERLDKAEAKLKAAEKVERRARKGVAKSTGARKRMMGGGGSHHSHDWNVCAVSCSAI
jgi:hypothetical protein